MRHIYLASLAALLTMAPAMAKYDAAGPDLDAALRAGYLIVPFESHASSDKEQLERDVVGPLMDAAGVERPWGFAWAVTGASNGSELFIRMKGHADDLNDAAGVMFLGMVLTDKGWDWRWAGYGLGLGVRPGGIALIRADGIDEYRWDGVTFMRGQ